MSSISLSHAQKVIDAALAHAREADLKPLSVAVLDSRGALKAAASEEGVSLKRFEVAHGKAHGALALGMGSRALGARAEQQAYFIAAASHVAGPLVPVPGGVLIKSEDGELLGAVGISGDTSDNDEAACLAGIKAAGLVGDPG